MSQEQKVALVAGATGVTGSHLIRQLIKDGSWKIYALARNLTDFMPKDGFEFIKCDLLDAADSKAKIGALKDVNYAFYCTWSGVDYEDPRNKTMLTNFIDNIGPKLIRVVVENGAKYYVGRFQDKVEDQHVSYKDSGSFREMVLNRTPFRENAPRLPEYNFYYELEDTVADRAAKRGFTYTIARPAWILGCSPGRALNFGLWMPVYAALCKQLNLPFVFPCGPIVYDCLSDLVDSDLLAEHLIWQATTEKCAGEAFNITNGDVFRYRNIWRFIADFYGLTVEPPQKAFCMAEWFKDKEGAWEDIVKKHGLVDIKLKDLIHWWVPDCLTEWVEFLLDMNKSREYGFNKTIDTEKAFKKTLLEYQNAKVIP